MANYIVIVRGNEYGLEIDSLEDKKVYHSIEEIEKNYPRYKKTECIPLYNWRKSETIERYTTSVEEAKQYYIENLLEDDLEDNNLTLADANEEIIEEYFYGWYDWLFEDYDSLYFDIPEMNIEVYKITKNELVSVDSWDI